VQPLTVVTWKWKPPSGYRSTYPSSTVGALRAMVERHYPFPFRFMCVTDDPDGIDPRVEIVPAWNDFATLPSPHGGKNPSCYRRLRMFHPEIGQVFGERFVSLDLDVVLTGDMTRLWQRPEPIVMWGDTNPQPGSHYNGSMVLMTAGARPQVWNEFDPVRSPQLSKANRCWGSDQGWISYCLGKGEARWGRGDGVYSFRNDLNEGRLDLPGNARIVIFHGRFDPWDPKVHARCAWVRKYYQSEVAACH
jgi:hypothetical protein